MEKVVSEHVKLVVRPVEKDVPTDNEQQPLEHSLLYSHLRPVNLQIAPLTEVSSYVNRSMVTSLNILNLFINEK